ncbi:extracellular solute-binding protein [Desulfococcaceae bacterium HSG8]|nr:extracellular solute-binding protein [Desulfococcaceae bacterium HSG8]
MKKRSFKTIHFVFLFVFVTIFPMFSVSSVFAETLKFLAWKVYVPEEYQKKFIQLVKEKHGVDLKLDIKYATTPDEFFPALRDNKADIITPSHNVPRDSRYQLIKHKLVLPLNLENIPNYKNVESSLQKAAYCTEGGAVYAVPIARGPYGLAYNTAILPEAPKSWNILWDPRFKDKYAIGKFQYEENIFSTALAMGFSRNDISNYKKLNTPKFQEKLAQLVANAHGMWEIEDKPKDLKGLSLATSWGDSLNGLKEMGEIWKMAEPVEGTTAWVDNFMISRTLKDKPKLKQIAEEWLNIVLSDEYQVYVVLRGIGTLPVITTIMDKLTPDEIARFRHDDPDHFKNNRILWPSLGKADRRGLKRLWDKAMKTRK